MAACRRRRRCGQDCEDCYTGELRLQCDDAIDVGSAGGGIGHDIGSDGHVVTSAAGRALARLGGFVAVKVVIVRRWIFFASFAGEILRELVNDAFH